MEMSLSWECPEYVDGPWLAGGTAYAGATYVYHLEGGLWEFVQRVTCPFQRGAVD